MNFLISLIVGLIVAGLIAPSEQFFQSNQTSDELTLILENLIEKPLKAVETNLIQAIDEFASQVEVIFSTKANENLDESMIPKSKLIWEKITTCLNDLESYMKSNGSELIRYQELVNQQQESKELVDKYKKLMHQWFGQLQLFINWELEVLNNRNKNYDWSKSNELVWKIESQRDSIVKLDELYSNGDVSRVFLPENNINKIIELQTEIMKTLGSFASSYREKIAGRFKVEKRVVIDKKKPIAKKNLVDGLREFNKGKPLVAPLTGFGGVIAMISIAVGIPLMLSHDSTLYDPIHNPRPRLHFYGTTPLSLSPENFYMGIILVLILVVVCTIVAFFLYRKKKAKSKLNRDNKELNKTNYHRSHSRHSSRFPSHHGSRFGRSSAYESRMSPIHSGDRRHRQMSSIPSNVSSSRMSSIPSNVHGSRMSSIPSNVPSSRMSSIQSNVPGSRMSSIVSNVPSSRMSSIQSNIPNSRMSTIPRDVPNNRMSPPIPNNPTYIILPPIQGTGPNYRIPSKANVEPYNRIPPNANVAPIYRIPSTTNDRPNLRMASNTNVGPNLRILSNTNDRPNLRIPSNTNVAPNLRIPSNTNVAPNLRIPSNIKVGPNDKNH